jgi:hypothetical protein
MPDRSAIAGTGGDSHPRGPICTDPTTPLTVNCYVRGDVNAASHHQILTIQQRLEALAATPLVDELRTRQWPPQSHAGADLSLPATRDRLVRRFERWAGERGYTLSPAVSRQQTPQSLVDTARSGQTIRVPLVLLAFEPATADTATLEGVVPYTVPSESGDAMTYTVADWLTAAEDVVDGVPDQSGRRDSDHSQSVYSA